MKKWSIITDSSCDFNMDGIASENIEWGKVPFTIRVGEKEYIDSNTIDIDEMLEDMENTHELSQSSCPSPGMWYELFEKADLIIAITISDKVSGSFSSANVAKEMILEKYPEKQIYILNSKSAGSVLTMYVLKAVECINQNMDFDSVVENLKSYAIERRTIFGLMSFNNLIKNGRVNKMVGIIAGKLGICGIGVASDEGKIVLKEKKRGSHRVIDSIINDMKEHKFNGGNVVISHCKNIYLARRLESKIKDIWNNTNVLIVPTGGLCSFYAERKGIIVAY